LPIPKPITAKAEFLWDSRTIVYPMVDDRGAPIDSNPITRPPDFRPVVHNSRLKKEVRRLRALETSKDTYFWHYDAGIRYCHYVDGWGIDWYGIYIGPGFYWIRSQNHRWWWFDTVNSRWNYWHKGFWWWQDPRDPGDIFVNVGNAYYSYEKLAKAAPDQNDLAP